MNHLSSTRARGLRDLLVCARIAITPVKQKENADALLRSDVGSVRGGGDDASAGSVRGGLALAGHAGMAGRRVDFVGVTDCPVLDWFNAIEMRYWAAEHWCLVRCERPLSWFKRNRETFSFVGKVLGVAAVFALVFAVVCGVMLLWPKG